MKIVFVVTSFWAYGELLIAKEFADKIADENEILFLIPPTHKKSIGNRYRIVTLVPKSRKINQILLTEIKMSFNPDLVILSDFLNYAFADRHYGLLREDLDILECKIATFDNFDWKLNRSCMDTYGFKSDIPKKISIDDYGPRIIPCPLGNPEIKKMGEYRFSLFTDNIQIDLSKEKEKLKRKLLPSNYDCKLPVILISNATWQDKYVDNRSVKEFIEFSNRQFEKLILILAKKYTIICIGEEKSVFKGVENILMLRSVPADVFNDYAKLSDAYIGLNATSTSMIKICLGGTPCINIINSIAGKISDELNNENIYVKAYKFCMFPVGWYSFLKRLIRDNEYFDLITFCELFKLEETLNTIYDLVENKKTRDSFNDNLRHFQSKVRGLPDPSVIIKDIVGRDCYDK